MVGAVFQPLGTTSMTTVFTVRRGGDVIAEGTLRHVCVDASTFVKAPWPVWLRTALTA